LLKTSAIPKGIALVFVQDDRFGLFMDEPQNVFNLMIFYFSV